MNFAEFSNTPRGESLKNPMNLREISYKGVLLVCCFRVAFVLLRVAKNRLFAFFSNTFDEKQHT